MRVRMTVVLGSLALVFGAQAALACSEETELKMFDALQVAKIKPGVGKTHFYTPACDAGAKGLEACRRAAYVMPGDPVLIGDVYDTTACATFVDAKGRATSGVIKGDRVAPISGSDKAAATQFVGTWIRDEAKITVTARGQVLSFNGDATYGAKDPNRVKRGAVNLGNILFSARTATNRISVGLTGKGELAEDKAKAAATDCQLDMIALGPYLVVRDNMMCGGMNVSFTGIYRKQ